MASRSPAAFQLPDLSQEPEADEVWVIGPAPDPKWGRVCALQLTEPVTLGAERVDAVMHRAGRRSDTLELLLPPGPLRRRLLLDPLAPLVAPRPAAPAPNPVTPPGWRSLPEGVRDPVEVRFIPGTSQVVAFFGSGDAVTWSLANTATRTVPRPKARACRGRIAFGWYHQRPLDVALDRGDVVAWSRATTRAALPAGLGAPVQGRGQAVSFGANTTWFTDGDGMLWHLGGHPPSVSPPAGRCLDLFPVQEYAVALVQVADGLEVRALGQDGTTHLRSHHPGPRFGFFTGFQNLPPSLVCCTDDRWSRWEGTVQVAGGDLDAAGRIPLAVTSEWDPAARQRTSDWLLWVPGTREFQLGSKRLTVPRTPILPRASADAKLVAFHTEEGNVEIWQVDSGQPLMLRCPRG